MSAGGRIPEGGGAAPTLNPLLLRGERYIKDEQIFLHPKKFFLTYSADLNYPDKMNKP